MILNTPLEKSTPQTTEILEQEQTFNWRNCWYPITFIRDLPENRPYSFTLYDEAYVLFRNQEGELVCLIDRCPHRAAKLSDGQIIDGKLECLYHGWQFGADGKCLHIPQLPQDADIPVSGCVKSFRVVEFQGLVWMWAGKAADADINNIPTPVELDLPGFVYLQKVTDIPCDQSYFIEHSLDPAHLHITHDGTRQGNRKKAQPLDMEILESSVDGFKCRFRETRKNDEPWVYMDFISPNIVRLNLNIEKRGWKFIQTFFILPLGRGRCRLISLMCRNFITWEAKLKPRWLIHMGQHEILEQDLTLLAGQQEVVENLAENLDSVYTPLPTSDTFVIEYRKWLDKFGSSLPNYRGYSSSKYPLNQQSSFQPSLQTRWDRHTKICSSCHNAHNTMIRIQQICIFVAIALATTGTIIDGIISKTFILGALFSIILLITIEKFKTKLEH